MGKKFTDNHAAARKTPFDVIAERRPDLYGKTQAGKPDKKK